MTIRQIMSSLENHKVTVWQWTAGFAGVLFVRFFLEQLSNPTSSSGIIASDAYTLVHYGLFFLAVTLGISFIVGSFTTNHVTALKFSLLALPLIWLAPLIDITTSAGEGRAVAYLLDSHKDLLLDFLTFFGPLNNYGITLGIRAELAIILAAIALYIWFSTGNRVKTLLGVILSYTFIFISLAMPGIIATLWGQTSEVGTLQFLSKSIAESNLTHNTLQEGIFSVPPSRFFELTFNKLMSQIFFILSAIFAFLHFWKSYTEKFKAIIANWRPARMLMYLFLLGLGVWFAFFYKFGHLGGPIDMLSLACLVAAWAGAWMYAVHVNDAEDIKIDLVSNPERPLAAKSVTEDEMKEARHIWLLLSLLGSWSVGFYPFFMNLVFLASYYIYSAPPLRLKCVPILSSFLISIACLSSVLAGFFFVSFDKRIGVFPTAIAFVIIVFFTLVSNIRDLKDVEGDKNAGVFTLPVILGENGPKIVGLLAAAGILSVPLFISLYQLYIFAIPLIFFGYKFIIKKPYKETPLFMLLFVFFVGIIFLTILK